MIHLKVSACSAVLQLTRPQPTPFDSTTLMILCVAYTLGRSPLSNIPCLQLTQRYRALIWIWKLRVPVFEKFEGFVSLSIEGGRWRTETLSNRCADRQNRRLLTVCLQYQIRRQVSFLQKTPTTVSVAPWLYLAASRFHLKSTLSPLPSCGRALLTTPVARNSR